MQESKKITNTISEDENILIEWPNDEGGIQKASKNSDNIYRMQEQAERAINIAMGNIRSMARRVAITMEQLDDKVRPDEAAVEFGINLDAEAGAFLAKASSGAQLKITLKWNIEQPERPKVSISRND